MKFGLMFSNGGPFSEPANAVGLAQLAEELGFESLWTVEHVVVPTGLPVGVPVLARPGRCRAARTCRSPTRSSGSRTSPPRRRASASRPGS